MDSVKLMQADPEANPAISVVFGQHDLDMAQSLERLVGSGRGGRRVSLYNQTYDRVLELFANGDPEKLTWLRKNVAQPLQKAKTGYANSYIDHADALYDNIVAEPNPDNEKKTGGLGIKPGSPESAAVMQYGEGKKIIGIDGDGKAITANYTLTDLKADFPDTWQNIVKAEQWFRQTYNDYIDRINAARQLIYPNAEENAKSAMLRAHLKMTGAEQAISDVDLELGYSNLTVERRFALLEQKRQLTYELQNATEEYKKERAAYESGDYLRNKRLNYRKDYFHHFQELQESGTLSGVAKTLQSSVDIDPQLVGVSDFTRPKSKWQGIFQQQGRNAYVEDAVGGMMKYIPMAEQAIYIDPVIAQYRGFISEMASATKQTRNANDFIEWMTNWTNDLAGKTNALDRSGQIAVGRPFIKAVKKLNSRAAGNKIAGNFSSAVAQFFNIQIATLYVPNPASWSKGAKLYAQYTAGHPEARAIMDQSTFLKERYIEDVWNKFDEKTMLNAPKRFADWMMQFGDKEAARLIWFSAYSDSIRKGGDINAAIQYADEITRKSVAGRGIGEVPTMQKATLTKLFAPFQVEVSNAYYAVGDAVRSGNVGGLAAWTVTSFLMNALAKAIRGSGVSWDPLGVLIETLVGFREDDEEAALKGEEGDTFMQKAMRLLLNETGEMISNAPFGSIVMGIVSSFDNDILDKLFEESNPNRFGVGNIGIQMIFEPVAAIAKGILNGKPAGEIFAEAAQPVFNSYIMPWGGTQLQRAWDAMEALGWIDKLKNVARELTGQETVDRMPGSYTDSGKLRFTIDDSNPWNVAQALMFGQYATKEGREYVDSGRKYLSYSNTEKANELYGMGFDPADAVQIARDTAGMKGYQVADYLIDAYEDVTNDQLSDMWRATVPANTSEYSNPFEAAANAAQYGVDTEKFLDVYSKWYDGEHQTQDSLKEILDSSGLSKAEKRGVWTAIGGMRAKPWAEKNNPYK